MAWPFSHVGPPTLTVNSSSMPLSLTTADANTCYLLGINFANSNSVPVTVTVRSSDGSNVLANQMEIPANFAVALPLNFKTMVGVVWSASASGVAGSFWGYK